MNSDNFFDPNPRIIAHRGDSQYFPENTIPAFLSAEKIGVDVIETDVHLTADCKVVIWHDETLDRETDGSGKVENFTLEELKSLDAGYRFTPDGKSFPFRGKGVTLASLDEALEELPTMRFNIDLKSENPLLPTIFADIVQAHNAIHRINGASLSGKTLKSLRTLLPGLATSYGKSEIIPLLLLQKLGIPSPRRILHGEVLQVPEFFGKVQVVTKQFIEYFHRLDMKVQIWTINEREEMIRFLNMGVDAVMTDNPRLLKDVCQAL